MPWRSRTRRCSSSATWRRSRSTPTGRTPSTRCTGSASSELREAPYRDLLKAVFSEPERLKPGQTRQALTEKAAREFAGLAQRLRARGHDPQAVAHFVNRLVFCMFAEDVGLLPAKLFQRMLEQGAKRPERFEPMARQLFAAMRTGGLVGFEEVAWFNGGLFDSDDALPLEQEDIAQALRAATLDWAEIDPSIFGTLFERGLDPDKRSQLGAHYTDRDKIMLIVEPVIVEPLTREWEETKRAIRAALDRAAAARSPSAATRASNDAQALHTVFLERLRRFRVLDPACGSGNFLYLALLALKDLEHRVNLDAEALGFQRPFPAVGPEAVARHRDQPLRRRAGARRQSGSARSSGCGATASPSRATRSSGRWRPSSAATRC